MSKLKIKFRQREALIGYTFILPWLIGFLLFGFFPFFYSFFLSLNEVTIGYEGIENVFVGAGNYVQAFVGAGQLDYLPALVVFIGEILLYTPLIIIFSLIIAILLKQNIKGKGILRTIYFLPVIILSGPVISELLNSGDMSIKGIENFIFLQTLDSLSPMFAKLINFIFNNLITVFWFAGVQIVIFLNGLQKIDTATYEAASIDGASPWQLFWKITLPIIKPLMFLIATYTIIQFSAFSNNKISLLIKDNMFNSAKGSGYGYSTALAWIFFLVLMALIGIFYFALREKSGDRE